MKTQHMYLTLNLGYTNAKSRWARIQAQQLIRRNARMSMRSLAHLAVQTIPKEAHILELHLMTLALGMKSLGLGPLQPLSKRRRPHVPRQQGKSVGSESSNAATAKVHVPPVQLSQQLLSLLDGMSNQGDRLSVFSRREAGESAMGNSNMLESVMGLMRSPAMGTENFCLVHVSLVPVIGVVGEQKTKPKQHSVQGLRALGSTPNLVACRSTTVGRIKWEKWGSDHLAVVCELAYVTDKKACYKGTVVSWRLVYLFPEAQDLLLWVCTLSYELSVV